MRSNLWILLIFVAPFVACNVRSRSIQFIPETLSVVQKFKDINNYCVNKYKSNLFSSESCISVYRYTDKNNETKAVGGANCNPTAELSEYNQFDDFLKCHTIQNISKFCIPECVYYASNCDFEEMPGFKYNPESGALIVPKNTYTYTKGDFKPPYRHEIMEYREKLCKYAFERRKTENSQANNCFSFCQYNNGGHMANFGTQLGCSGIVPKMDETLCSEYQSKLQKCIPECETCFYDKGIPGFKPLSPLRNDLFQFPSIQSKKNFNWPTVGDASMEISKYDAKFWLCREIYSNPARGNEPCLSFCLYYLKTTDHLYSFRNVQCNAKLGIGCYDKELPIHKEVCNLMKYRLGESIDECKDSCGKTTPPGPPVVIPANTSPSVTSTTTSVTTTTTKSETTTTPVQTTTNPSPLVSSSKTQEIPSTTAKVAPTTTKMTDFPGPIGIPTYGPEPTDEEPKEATVDPRNNQRATDPSPSATGGKKEEGGGPNLKLLWILLPVALIVLAVGGSVAGFLVHRRLKARKNKGKSKTVGVEMGTLPPPPSMPKKPSTRKRPYLKVTRVDETAPPPREMPSGQITDKKFKFEGKLDLDATGTHGKTTHQLDGAKSHSLRDVMFSDEMNRVFDMGSQVENVIPSPPREGVGEGGQEGQQQGQEGRGQQGEQGQQGGQGGEGAKSQEGQQAQRPN